MSEPCFSCDVPGCRNGFDPNAVCSKNIEWLSGRQQGIFALRTIHLGEYVTTFGQLRKAQGPGRECLLIQNSIKIIKKGGAGIIVTEPLNGLVNTIRQCTAHTMSPVTTTKWLEIPMLESDLKQLTEEVKEHLWRTNFVWLFADPGQLTAPPILELDMQDQEREQEALTVCKLDKRDARFRVGTWIFEAIHTLAAEGKVVIQKVGNRKTQRTGYMVISPDAERTFEAQYGPMVMAVSRLKSTRLGDDEQARAVVGTGNRQVRKPSGRSI
jgi:hypothetical protein